MGKIVVPTKFNKTGKRVLTTPLQGKWVCAPAEQRYRKTLADIEAKFKRRDDESRQRYIETMSHLIASYVSSSSTSSEERYMITKLLAEIVLKERGPIAPEEVSSCQRLSNQLRGVSGLYQAAEEAWRIYAGEGNKLWEERHEEIRIAMMDCKVMRDALWREISDHIHHQCHPEDEKPNN